MRLLAAIAAICFFGTGCASLHTKPTVHGIDNFGEVAPGIFRGGQPKNAEGWAFLKSLGVRYVVKLNGEDEAPDPENEFVVQEFPISLEEQMGLPGGELERTVNGAVWAIHPGTFIHCTHGQDRTGLVVGEFRVRRCGWTRKSARREMADYGFHPILLGLEGFWILEKP